MRLNADIIYQNLRDVLSVKMFGSSETALALYRPEFYLDKTSRFQQNHVYVCSADHLPSAPAIEDNVLLICLGEAPQRKLFEKRCCVLSIAGDEDIFSVFNIVQGIFNKYEAWETELSRILRDSASLQELLDSAKGILDNPMQLIGADFHYLAYTEKEYLKNHLGIQLDSPIFDPDLMDTFLSLHDLATSIKEPILLSLMGRNTLSINLFDADEFLGCLTVFEEYREFRASDVQLCQFFAESIRQAFLLRPHLAGDRAALRDALRQMIGGEPLRQEQRNTLSKHAGRAALLCAVFKPAPNSNPLPSGYVSSLIEQQFRDSLAFEYNDNVTAFVPAVGNYKQQLDDILRKLRLTCGVSHRFSDLYESAYAFYQASSALRIGADIASESIIYLFEDCIPSLLLRNATANIPARYFYSEGLSHLASHDKASAVSYIETLKTYLDCNMSIAETSRRMNLHRSSLLDRLSRITQILGCDLTNPLQRLAIQIVLHADRTTT